MRMSKDFIELADSVRTRQASVYAEQNQCQLTDIESEVNSLVLDEARTVRLFKDYKGRHRIVLFIDGAGVSGVMTCPDGEIFYKETAPHAKGNRITRQLQAMLTIWGVNWHRSEFQTDAGYACYKDWK